MQEGDWWMVSHEPARRRRGQIVCCRLSTPISRGDVLEVWFLVDSKCKSARVDNANGSNCVSLTGLDVEKKRGEDAPPVTGSVAQMAHGSESFGNAPYSTGNCWCRSVKFFCEGNDIL